MRILVCMKQVPDTGEVKLSTDFTLERDFVAQVMNPADESALELALELRDLHGGEVVALTMGPERAESMLREAIARGADRAVLMTALTFVLGVIPMVYATGAGAASRNHIGVTVYYGMIAATTAGLLMIPALYSLFEKMRESSYALVGKSHQKEETK